MNKFNEYQILECKYCKKECFSINSLKQHECRCRENPNKIVHSGGHKKGYKMEKSPTKGTICITDGIHEKYINPTQLNAYIELGWYKGRCNSVKEKLKNNLINTGKAKTPEMEIIRKERISQSMKNNPNGGGYRKNSGRGHKGKYKGIYFDSSWELAFIVYYIEHNLKIKRCNEYRSYIFNNEQHKYIPDFITDDGIIEIKGFSTPQWKAKESQNKDIKVLYYKQMKKYLEYCENKYGKEFWKILKD